MEKSSGSKEEPPINFVDLDPFKRQEIGIFIKKEYEFARHTGNIETTQRNIVNIMVENNIHRDDQFFKSYINRLISPKINIFDLPQKEKQEFASLFEQELAAFFEQECEITRHIDNITKAMHNIFNIMHENNIHPLDSFSQCYIDRLSRLRRELELKEQDHVALSSGVCTILAALSSGACTALAEHQKSVYTSEQQEHDRAMTRRVVADGKTRERLKCIIQDEMKRKNLTSIEEQMLQQMQLVETCKKYQQSHVEKRAKKSQRSELVIDKTCNCLSFATEKHKKQDTKTTVARKKKQ